MFEEPGQGRAGDIISVFPTPMAILGNTAGGSMNGWGSFQIGMYSCARMGMSKEMWSFIARCLTSDPAARPKVDDLLKVCVGLECRYYERCTAANYVCSFWSTLLNNSLHCSIGHVYSNAQ
jgi:hypothetical protein